jgi:methionyl-tRNA formyltransferase
MQLVFMGSPMFAVPSLKALEAAGHTFSAIYTQPPRPAGRGQKLTPTAVHHAAEELGLGPIRTPERLKGEALSDLLATPADAIIVVAYGLLLPKAVVESRICLNVHPSALPRWRGPAPLQHTLLNGETATEICIMKLDEGMDTGPVFSRTPLEVPVDMTYGELHDLTAHMGAEALVEVLANLPHRQPASQKGEATLAPKITPAMRRVDFTQPATAVHNHIRALAPSPGATAQFGSEVVKLLGSEVLNHTNTTAPGTITRTETTLSIACNPGTLSITRLQRPSARPMPVEEALRGWNPQMEGERA